jgi:hypothetical protein
MRAPMQHFLCAKFRQNAKNRNKKEIFHCNIPLFLKKIAKFRENSYLFIYLKTFHHIWALLLVW